MTIWGQSEQQINNTKYLCCTQQLIRSPFLANTHKHTSELTRMFTAQFWAGALCFPSNLIVSLLASDLWHFRHSSHLLVSHLPGSTPAALNQTDCLQPQLLFLCLPVYVRLLREREREREGTFLVKLTLKARVISFTERQFYQHITCSENQR